MSAPPTIRSPVGAEVVVEGRRYVNFAGSSYLGLSGIPDIVEAGIAALRTSGSGYQFPRDYGFATAAHLDAESAAAEFFESEAALYLPSGYQFALVAAATLRDRVAIAFIDEWSHHCLRDALKAADLRAHSFRHLDREDLEGKLRGEVRAGETPLVVTDGMFGTFGEIAPLADYERLVEPYGGLLLIDESHSFGVLGHAGRGAAEERGLRRGSFVAGGSTGKGLGVLGGILPGTAAEVARFRRAPASRGASAGQPASAAMLAASLRHIRRHPGILHRLRENVGYLKAGLRGLGIDVGDSIAPVATFVPAQPPKALQARLMAEGLHVLVSNYIGVGERGAIRCTIFADHTRAQMDRLLDALRRFV